MGVSGQLHTYMLLRACGHGPSGGRQPGHPHSPGVALASPPHSPPG